MKRLAWIAGGLLALLLLASAWLWWVQSGEACSRPTGMPAVTSTGSTSQTSA